MEVEWSKVCFSTDRWNLLDPKAGVMMRETLTENSRNTSVLLSSSTGVNLVWRDVAGRRGASSSRNQINVPYWVKLIRSANIFTGYMSGDGNTWTQVGSPVKIYMTDKIYIGLAVTAGNRDGSRLNTSSFDNVTIRRQPMVSQ